MEKVIEIGLYSQRLIEPQVFGQFSSLPNEMLVKILLLRLDVLRLSREVHHTYISFCISEWCDVLMKNSVCCMQKWS